MLPFKPSPTLLNPMVEKTGDHMVLSATPRTKVSADHAGLSPPLEPSRVSTKLWTESFQASLNNNSLIAQLLIKVAMVDGPKEPCNTLSQLLLNKEVITDMKPDKVVADITVRVLSISTEEVTMKYKATAKTLWLMPSMDNQSQS